MRYALHDLSDVQFESLVTQVCYELLGPGIEAFAAGPDGGRDAKFVGTAQEFPSRTAPLVGTIIVQAKHTTNPIGKFSDSDFGGDAGSSTLSKEIPKIRTLHQDGKLDHYLLFANRRLSAGMNEKIIDRLKKETGVDSIHLLGAERIEIFVKRYPFLADSIRSYEYDLPLRASPDDLANVISAIASAPSSPPSKTTQIERTAFKKKNSLNGLSTEYARVITKNHLKNFGVVQDFLADPINFDATESYNSAVEEFATKLAAYRQDFSNYDKLLNHLLSTLIERDGVLRTNKRLTRTVFYFMYWACDIGTEVNDDPTD